MTTTRYVLDPGAGLTEVLSDGTNTYLYGNDRLGQYQSAMQYFGPDGLGSVRQIYDASAQVIGNARYDPYGNAMAQSGATSVFAFAGEQYDATGLTYLRARYYSSAQGRFTTRDVWAGDPNAPMSYNDWLYVYANPANSTDPSGHAPPCPVTVEGHTWDCEAFVNVWGMRQAFVESAARHNKIPTMDNNGFAALVASVMVSERRIGNKPPISDPRNRLSQNLEDLAAMFGCTVSGNYLEDAVKQGDLPQLLRYFFNEEVPGRATVGWGNVSSDTAANLWKGQACTRDGDCTPVQPAKLQMRNALGWQIDIANPFGTQVACAGGTCTFYQPSETESYARLTLQLTDPTMNIEYVAANLEAGAQRARWIGLRPSAFNSALWHLFGVQKDAEIDRAHLNPGGAVYIVEDIPLALDVLGLTTTWSPTNENEPQYLYWKAHGAP